MNSPFNNETSRYQKAPAWLYLVQLLLPALLGFGAYKVFSFSDLDRVESDGFTSLYVLAVFAVTNWHVVFSVLLGIGTLTALIAAWHFNGQGEYEACSSGSKLFKESLVNQLTFVIVAVLFAGLIISGIAWKAWHLRMIWYRP